jgi:outer membrane receptor protein involved in Fe transport
MSPRGEKGIKAMGKRSGLTKVFKWVVLVLSFLILALPLVSLAQEYKSGEEEKKEEKKPIKFKLEEIVVTATKKEVTLLETPATISIITAEDIENSGMKDIGAIISSVPGVLDDSSGFTTYFSFRGTRSSATEGPVIFVDGRPWNFGRYNYSKIDDIPVDVVERIEIIKSPPASVYGTNSSRGVINIITKTGKYAQKPIEATLSGGIGIWDTYKALATISGKKNQWDYNLKAVYEESKGYRHTDPERKVIDGQLGYEFAEGIRLDAYMGWNDVWRKTGSPLKYWALEDRRQNDPPDKQTGATYRIRPNESDHQLLSGGLAFKYEKDKWLLNSSAYLSHFDDVWSSLYYYNNPGNGTTQRGQGCYQDDRDEDKVDFRISGGRTFSNEDILLTDTITLGYDYSWNDWKQNRTYPYATSLSSSTQDKIKKANIDYKRKIHGIFVNNELKYGKWGLLSGLRYDMVDYDVKNEVPDSVKKEFKELGWNVAPSYSFTHNNNLFFSIGQSYWFPAAYYFTAAMDADYSENRPEDLKQEKYTNYEIGFKHRLAKFFNYSISLYRTEIDNKYMPFYDDAGKYKGYKHIGKSIHQGIDLEADGRPFDWFGYRLGFGWIDAEWDKAKTTVYIHGATPADDTYQLTDISGKKLIRVPKYQYRVGLDFYPLKNWQFSIDGHGFGKQYIDALNRYKNKAVNLADAKLTYNLKSWKFYIAGSNIFNVEYESIWNTAGKRNPDGTPDHGYYPKDGRYFEIGATVKF